VGQAGSWVGSRQVVDLDSAPFLEGANAGGGLRAVRLKVDLAVRTREDHRERLSCNDPFDENLPF